MELKKKYFSPTPAKWRKFGDALLAVSTYAEVHQAVSGRTDLLTAIVFVGIVGKFLTNFFSK